MPDKDEIEINKLKSKINDKIYEYQNKYYIKPKFLKVNRLILNYLINPFDNTFILVGGTAINTFMGLAVCDTLDIDLLEVEVF